MYRMGWKGKGSLLAKISSLFSLNGFVLALLTCGSACVRYDASAQSPKTHVTWSNYEGTPDAAQFSALDQINRSNVTRLQIAWKYSTGDGNKYLFNPIVVDGVMYVLAKQRSIVAQRAVDPQDRSGKQTRHVPRDQLLGEYRPVGSALAILRKQLLTGDRCADG